MNIQRTEVIPEELDSYFDSSEYFSIVSVAKIMSNESDLQKI